MVSTRCCMLTGRSSTSMPGVHVEAVLVRQVAHQGGTLGALG